jgi:hypothetical protein
MRATTQEPQRAEKEEEADGSGRKRAESLGEAADSGRRVFKPKCFDGSFLEIAL